ncbi:MAG: response regulator, partial [Candidatus Lokiarchaeota archaeon]
MHHLVNRSFRLLKHSSQKKILLVDDEESIHLLYREEFEEEGYEVHSALSGEEALEKLKIIKPDLVILDINMPGMNGIDALRRIKEIDPNLKVILSSAYQEFKQDLASWASDEYIVKSSNLEELKAAVKRHLS